MKAENKIFTFQTNIETAIEAAQGVVTRTAVSLTRPGALVILRLAQGTRNTLAGWRRSGHDGTFPGIFRLTADPELSRELSAGEEAGLN